MAKSLISPPTEEGVVGEGGRKSEIQPEGSVHNLWGFLPTWAPSMEVGDSLRLGPKAVEAESSCDR